MPLWKIAWRSIQRRWLASVLTTLSMALGVMMVVLILLVLGIVSDSFRNNSSLGYNMIVGAKGGRLQLTLNTVFYLSQPVENIPYSYYLEFLPAARRPDGQDGRFAMYTARVIPLCLGDYFGPFRVVGTAPEMFDNYVYDVDRNRKFEFAQGRNFQTWTQEHGFFEAIVGAKVAREMGLRVGDTVSPTHGSKEGSAHEQFYVVGILKASGTPHDRAVFVNMEGFYLLEGHAKPVPPKVVLTAPPEDNYPNDKALPASPREDNYPNDKALLTARHRDTHAHHHDHRRKTEPLPIDEREVTALLVRTRTDLHPATSLFLTNTINEGPIAQAVLPIKEIYSLFELIVNPIQRLLLVITFMICVVSGVGILVSIYNSMSDRRREIAIMRSLGASRRTVMVVILLESILLSLGGGLAGWAAGHAVMGVAGPYVESYTGVRVSPFQFSPPVRAVKDASAITELVELTGGWARPIIDILLSPETLLVPTLILLAVAVGFLPAVAAYRTDVAKALASSP